ncbi:MAG: phosphoethanolamine transferase [bacterium]
MGRLVVRLRRVCLDPVDRRFARLALVAFAIAVVPRLCEVFFVDQPGPYYARCLASAAALALAGAGIISLLRAHRLAPLLLLIGLAFGVFHLGHVLIYGCPPTAVIFAPVFETSGPDVAEFVAFYLTPAIAAGLVAYVGGVCLLVLLLRRWIPPQSKTLTARDWRPLGLGLVMLSLAWLAYGEWAPYSIFDLLAQYRVYQQEQASFAASFKRFAALPALPPVTPAIAQQVVVLVIGEATSRNRMRLYGYERDTTPELSARADLWRFDNVVAPNSHTVPALSKVLTLATHENGGRLPYNANIVQLARLAGYRTYWISNQPPLGPFSTPIATIAAYADQVWWLNDGRAANGDSPTDEGVLAPLRAALQRAGDASALIVVHLMGTHSNYRSRYPDAFDVFQGVPPSSLDLDAREQTLYNAYDSAVRYTDHVVAAILAALTQSPASNQVLIYLSDHAEEVFDFRHFSGHSQVIQSNFMFEVPLLLWTNPTHVKRAAWQSLVARHQHALYSTEDFIHLLHDILGVRSPFYDPARSLLSEAFVERPVMVGTEWYDGTHPSPLRYVRTRNDIAFAQKLWVRSVDTLPRLLALAARGYRNFAVDVAVDDASAPLDVRPPPGAPGGQSFEGYLQADGAAAYRFWLNVDGVGAAAAPALLARLAALDTRYDIRPRIIVGSSDAATLAAVAESGYLTSLSLPQPPQDAARWQRVEYAESAAARMTFAFSAVAQEATALPSLEQFFPDCDLLLWGHGKLFESDPLAAELVANPRVKLLLVDVVTPGGG